MKQMMPACPRAHRLVGYPNPEGTNAIRLLCPWVGEDPLEEEMAPLRRQHCGGRHNTKGHCHPRASSAKTRGFHTQLDEGPETP